MKRRRHKSAKQQGQDRPHREHNDAHGSRNSGHGGRRGGPRSGAHGGPRAGSRGGPRRPPREEKPVPTTLLALAQPPHARVFNRDLANVGFTLVYNPKIKVEDGDIIKVEPMPRPRFGPTPLKIIENLGPGVKGVESEAAIANHGIPVDFDPDALHQAETLPAYRWNPDDKRTDWRGLPIVTIDGEDARDFDDAVWAEPLDGGGFRIIVAIADVAFYISPGSALDKDARERGNSTYFPDRVVPMLPERLSNNLCSLRPREDRPVLGVEMDIDANGKLGAFRFHRAAIHSAARLTYNQVQAALDGATDETTQKLLPALKNLEAAYKVLLSAKAKRGALDLDLPETMVMVDKDGEVLGVGQRARKDAHRLIEELMILANVAAATALSKNKYAGLYRVHAAPDATKLANLKGSLGPLGFKVPAAESGNHAWARLVEDIQGHPAAPTLLRQVLQSQMQARYHPENTGHYGLALPLYSHFTSPIRRYADLVTHRALINAFRLGEAQTLPSGGQLNSISEHLAVTERRSQHAEWEARDRMMARYYADQIDEEFEATITSALTFGLFITLPSGAEGLLPARLLPHGFSYNPRELCWHHGRRKLTWRPGTKLVARLIDADWVGGRLTFAPVEKDDERPPRPPHRQHGFHNTRPTGSGRYGNKKRR